MPGLSLLLNRLWKDVIIANQDGTELKAALWGRFQQWGENPIIPPPPLSLPSLSSIEPTYGQSVVGLGGGEMVSSEPVQISTALTVPKPYTYTSVGTHNVSCPTTKILHKK